MSREIELALVERTRNYLKYEQRIGSIENSISPKYDPQPEIIVNAYLHRNIYGEKVPKGVKVVIEE